MEGVGARLGRSSSRYGTTTVFSGPVRRWKKNWVSITPPPSSSSSNNNNNNNHSNHHNHSNGSINGGASSAAAVSHLRLYKWTPLSNDSKIKTSPSDANNSNHDHNHESDSPARDDDAVAEEPPRRKFKFIPVAILEEQKKEDEEISEDEAKPIDADEDNGEHVSKSDGYDEKPDINDMPMEESQGSEENQAAPTRQDLNELDLSLGLTSHDEELDSGSKKEPSKDAQPDRAKTGSARV